MTFALLSSQIKHPQEATVDILDLDIPYKQVINLNLQADERIRWKVVVSALVETLWKTSYTLTNSFSVPAGYD